MAGGFGWSRQRGRQAQGAVRATDADRDNVRTILEGAHAEGRLSWDDFNARSSELTSAKTYDELATLTTDLPSHIPLEPPQVYQPGTPFGIRSDDLPGGVRPVNALAVASLICGVGQILFWVLTGIPAIVLGHIARIQIKRSGEQGAGLALAGLLLGYAGLGLAIVTALIIYLIVVVVTHHH